MDAGAFVVVDLGGTQIRTAVADRAARLSARRAIGTPRTSPDGVITAVVEEIKQAIAGHSDEVVAVGVSALGPVDANGTIASAPTLIDFDHVPLGQRLRDALDLPVHIDNDANAAAIAEWRLGAGRGTQHFCYITVSTGIGCGIISNGQLITGRTGYAGEFGRTRIPFPAGGTAQLEQLSSGSAIAAQARALMATTRPSRLRELGASELTAERVAAVAADGDEAALDLITSAAVTLGCQLANLVRLLDPDVIAVGGGVSRAGPAFWDPLITSMTDSLAADAIPAPKLVEAELHDDVGLYGAALALQGRYGTSARPGHPAAPTEPNP